MWEEINQSYQYHKLDRFQKREKEKAISVIKSLKIKGDQLKMLKICSQVYEINTKSSKK